MDAKLVFMDDRVVLSGMTLGALARRTAHSLQAFQFQLQRLFAAPHLLRVQEERSGLIGHLIALGQGVYLCAARRLTHASQFVSLRLVIQRHVGTRLNDGGRGAFDAGGVTPNLRQSTTGVKLGYEGIFRDTNGRLRLLLVQTREYQVGILLESEFHGLPQRQGMHFRECSDRRKTHGRKTEKQYVFQHSLRVAEPSLYRPPGNFPCNSFTALVVKPKEAIGMLARFSRRMLAVKTVVLFSLSGAAWMVHGADFDRARDLVSRVQSDLQRAEDFTRTNEKERSRYENVQHHLSEFDRDLRRDHFDKGKLDSAIDNLKDVVKNNTLEGHDRDALAADLSDLRTLRDIR